MSRYALPAKETLREIAARQEEKEREIEGASEEHPSGLQDHDAAAQLIQRNYRGYRARRELKGHDLSGSTRWLEAVKDAQYKIYTKPVSHDERAKQSSLQGPPPGSSIARDKWKRAGVVARRAGADDPSETETERDMTEEQSEEHRRLKEDAKVERARLAKTMGLEYFLEMVDQKHRYGSNLRAYHKAWQQSGTRDNFFYWLDHGEGTEVDLEDRPRKRLDEEQVRYLSREERKSYLVTIDKQGLLCWAKNGERITTSPGYKDSMDGIVPISDIKTPTWRDITGRQFVEDSSSESEAESDISVGSNDDTSIWTDQGLHEARGIQKLQHRLTGAVSNKLMGKNTKKNTWIFVADTSLRFYIGIKQSGGFQHSSFLHGARVSAAGLIRTKRGQLRRLSPLSGHYSPPVKNFRGFVKSMRDAGADMSHVNITRSYSILIGLEAYLGAKNSIKQGERQVKDILNPKEAKHREEEQRDNSKSAERERAVLEAQAQQEAEIKRQQSIPGGVVKRLRVQRN